MKIIKKQIINAISISSNTNNREKKRNRKSKEYNDKGHTSKWLKTVINNQENDKYITFYEIKELIKNSNRKELKKNLNISKFYDN